MSALPQLLDRKMLAEETGLPRSAIDAIFRQVPVVTFPECRKVFVKRADVAALIDRGTWKDDGATVRA